MFSDRKEAAKELAKALEKYKNKKVIVLGIPRGGAETAYYVAKYLEAELSLLISRKLGHPGEPEFAFGALAEDGSIYLNKNADSEVSREMIDEETNHQTKEIQRRIKVLRKGKPLPDINGKTVILVDDGIATGATVFAAIKMCRRQGAEKIVVAAPVCSAGKEKEILKEADEAFILEKPPSFFAVSQAYASFYNLTDEQAVAFMEKWEKEKNIAQNQ
ncbi:MAG TPA: phosphoribosyltransferase family protein [Puia sp.]|uniref:phosphoribosyltransferase n=1 Tax=Puia sp. TaxID=2045100 RepID=UPI002CC8A61A|nr:phosphoribosyltransferase family protein [Puia sp.]HVU97102.1 phosphoribosyltransferase family protein [Puia sp.]